MSHLKYISISHQNAPFEVRESFAFSEQEVKAFLVKCKKAISLDGVIVVSTCNRTEVYYDSEEDFSETLFNALLRFKNIERTAQIHCYLIASKQNAQSCEHLFRVALGLESQVIGDLQIINQVKRSYKMSAGLGMVSPYIHKLMHTVFYANKKVVQETCFRDGAASLAYIAVETVEEIAMNFRQPRVLVVGLGEIGHDVVDNLKSLNIDAKICLSNRTLETTKKLAKRYGFDMLEFEQVSSKLSKYDIIISCIGLATPFFTKDKVEPHLGNGHKYFIDLSMPRSVAQEIDELNNVLVYHTDELRAISEEAVEKRKAAIPEVEKILKDCLLNFGSWQKESHFSPVIKQLKVKFEEIRQKELRRYENEVNSEQKQILEEATKNILQDIIKLPVLQIKDAYKRGESEELTDSLQELFKLD